MNTRIILPQKRKGYILLSSLLLFSFYTAFYPRVVTAVGIPDILNFLHLILVPFACVLTLTKTRLKDRRQILVAKELIFALFLFFTVVVASGYINKAGIINIFFDFILFCEHFLLLLTIISIGLSPEKLRNFRAHIIIAGIINSFFAYFQFYVLRLQTLGAAGADNIKGVFIGQGAGHVVGASVALTFGLFYLLVAKTVPFWIRLVVFLVTFWHMNMADAKQVILVLGLAWIVLLLSKVQNIGKFLQYFIPAVVVGVAFYWATQNLPEFRAFNIWIRPEIYGPNGEATLLKTSVFRIVPTYYQSFLNPLFGLGPGHTIGRLGGWMLREYNELLVPLGASIHPASNAIWDAVRVSWLGDQSSMFSPMFGWAAIWGDLGFVGLVSFTYIWSIVWRKLCVDDISKYLVVCIFLFGLVFSQMEEPGYMLYVAAIIGIQYQEHQSQKLNHTRTQLEQAKPLRPKSLKSWMQRLLLIK
ncbi:MAG: hypothetical protein KME64_24170 [Scytonematopsis contorta HA4267-MV1]|jgi:hypothetical protein|nr:hypothetical protein [Scytonematopsis contorta HA4267-MV1]